MKGLSLLTQIAACQLPEPQTEYRFAPPRRWRFDFCYPDRLLAVEIEGGVWKGKSRHTTGKGFSADIEKYSEALCLGYRVLRVTTQQVENGQAIGWLERLLKP